MDLPFMTNKYRCPGMTNIPIWTIRLADNHDITQLTPGVLYCLIAVCPRSHRCHLAVCLFDPGLVEWGCVSENGNDRWRFSV